MQIKDHKSLLSGSFDDLHPYGGLGDLFHIPRELAYLQIISPDIRKHRFKAEKLNVIFICQKKRLVTFSRARTGMNESGSFVQVWMKSRASTELTPCECSNHLV